MNSGIRHRGRWCALYSDNCEVVALDTVDTSEIKSDDRRRRRLAKDTENARTGNQGRQSAASVDTPGDSGWLESDQETVLGGEDHCHSDDEYFQLPKQT